VFLIGVQPVLPDLTEFRHFSLKTTGDRHTTGEQQISRLDNNIAKKHSLTSNNTRGDHRPPSQRVASALEVIDCRFNPHSNQP